MKGSEFIFDYVHLLYYKYRKINPNHGGSYIFSRLNKKEKSNNKSRPKKNNKHFQYVVIVMLNHEEIKKIHKE